jgi:hypothetical protein
VAIGLSFSGFSAAALVARRYHNRQERIAEFGMWHGRGGQVARKTRKAPIHRVRRRWTRNPAEKPHSTRKGEKGYNRKREKRSEDEE